MKKQKNFPWKEDIVFKWIFFYAATMRKALAMWGEIKENFIRDPQGLATRC